MKKIVKYIMILLIIPFLLYFFALIYDMLFVNHKEKNEYRVSVTIVATDYEKTKNIDFKKDDSYFDYFLKSFNFSEKVTKEGDYYVASVTGINSKFYKRISLVTFALDDVLGNVIDDAKYDQENNKIYIPEKYYKSKEYDKYNGCPIRLELVTRVTDSEFNNNEINVKINKFLTENKTIKIKNETDYPEVSLFKYKKGLAIAKKDFYVYINGDKTPISSDRYKWDSKTGVISFNFSAMYLEDLKIVFRKSALVKNMFITPFKLYVVDAISSFGSFEYDNGVGAYDAKTRKTLYQAFNGKTTNQEFEYYYGEDGNWFDPNPTTSYPNGRWRTDDYPISDSVSADTDGSGLSNFDIYIGEITFTTTYHTKLNPDYSSCEGKEGDALQNCKTKQDEIAEAGVDLTAKFKIKVNKWVSLYCSEARENGIQNNPKNTITTSVTIAVSEDSSKVTVTLKSLDSAGDQFASGTFQITGSTYELSIKKKLNEGGNISDFKQKKIYFKIFDSKNESGSCTGYIGKAYTNSDGIAKFTGLPRAGQYCVKEAFKEEKSSSTISNKNYFPNADCNYASGYNNAVMVSTGTQVSVGNWFCNIPKYYCLKIQKIDQPTGGLVNGITFQMDSVYSATTGGTPNHIQKSNLSAQSAESGVAIYDMLNYSSTAHTIYETSENGTKATLVSGNSNYFYWNTDSTTAYTGKASEMSYRTSDAKYQCSSSTTTLSKTDRRVYYCARVKKVDADTGAVLGEAGFTAYRDAAATIQVGSEVKTASSPADKKGIAEFFFGNDNNGGSTYNSGNYYIKETSSPEGYSVDPNVKTVPVTVMNSTTTSSSWNDSTKCSANAESFVYRNTALKITWYKLLEDVKTTLKTTESSKKPKFTVKNSSGNKIYHTATKVTTTNSSGTESRDCYQYSATSTGTGSDIFETDNDGQICVRGVPKGTYTITETQPGQYHTFGDVSSINVTTSSDFAPVNTTGSSRNVFVNIPTGFEFTKKVANVDGGDGEQKIVVNGVEKTLTELTTEELKKLDFEIYLTDAAGNPTGNPLEFVLKNGIYEYVGNTIDGPGQTGKTTILHLNDNRKIRVDHLAWGTTYAIREVQSKVCDASKSEEDCIGYYYPNYSEQTSTFTITTCSNPSANTTSCPNGSNKYATQQLTNTPTEIQFTKKDFYHYNDQADIEDKDRESDEVDESVEFENDKERSDFDRITFKIKDSSGKYLTLKFIGNNGSCKDDNSYALYKYVPSDQTDAEGTELHTCGGHIRITNLCRGNDYKIEEISVPEDSVYVKENTGSTPTEVSYKIPCTDGSYTQESTTNLISDKPTRARFEKRDSKYNYLINDETTTFKLYRCDKGTECHPGDYTTDEERESNGMELVKFYERGVITGDEEDPNDAEGLIGVEVYRRMSDSDAEKQGAKIITELHPYRGILVMRYLQANYNYVLLETVAPKNYQMPIGRNAETPFTTTSETVDVDPVDIPNKPTSLLIKKYDSKGNLLPGAEFKIYEGTTCDKNLSAMNQPKKELKLKTKRDGIYENRETKDTYTIKTCTDKENEKCSDINPNGSLTRLTYETNLGTWTDFADESTRTEDGKKIEIQEGVALVQYLEYGHCYIIEEVKAPEGHTLPSKAEDRFTMITIDENDEYAHSTYYKFINKPTPFQFYKYDEFNKLIDGAEFKLQKLDDNKKYQDVTVTLDNDLENLATIDDTNSEELNKKIEEYQKQAEEGVPFYKVDKESSNTTITTKNGTAVVYYLQAGQYRILETKAPEGKELPKNPNIATFFVDENGNVYGNSVITNKSITKKIERKNEASAIFIIAPQTGQTVIKYGLLISLLVAAITGLIILKKKME